LSRVKNGLVDGVAAAAVDVGPTDSLTQHIFLIFFIYLNI